MGPLDEYECMYRSLEKYSKGDPLRAIFNVAEMGRFNVGEIGTGGNIHPTANMDNAIDSDKRNRNSDMCRQRQRQMSYESRDFFFIYLFIYLFNLIIF